MVKSRRGAPRRFTACASRATVYDPGSPRAARVRPSTIGHRFRLGTAVGLRGTSSRWDLPLNPDLLQCSRSEAGELLRTATSAAGCDYRLEESSVRLSREALAHQAVPLAFPKRNCPTAVREMESGKGWGLTEWPEIFSRVVAEPTAFAETAAPACRPGRWAFLAARECFESFSAEHTNKS